MKKLFLFLLIGLAVGSGVSFSFIESRNVWFQVFGATAGAVFIIGFLGALYSKTGLQFTDRGMKILDWLFIAMTITMMGCFQLIGVYPFYWFLIVFLPLFATRIVISVYVKRSRKTSIQDGADNIEV